MNSMAAPGAVTNVMPEGEEQLLQVYVSGERILQWKRRNRVQNYKNKGFL
jgi:hypothetical protein